MQKLLFLFGLLLCFTLADNVNGLQNCLGSDFAVNCLACTQFKCVSCEAEYILTDGKCVQLICNDPNCAECPRNAAVCRQCQLNYAPNSLGECEPLNCGNKCLVCHDNYSCRICLDIYANINGQCL